MYHDAKMMQIGVDDHTVSVKHLIIKVEAIAKKYSELGCSGFGTKLNNASKDLFTFVNHPGMEPTNNESERMLCFIVIDRKIRHRICSARGMEVYSTLMTCVLTWKKQKLNLVEKLLEVLGAT